mmetsp:Transcript_123075/g.292610  ORF Transcript_123075/g.292610 Transcript_123075/m.292610 type:complete len:265 (+) Transcript_123075:964-1758(+)
MSSSKRCLKIRFPTSSPSTFSWLWNCLISAARSANKFDSSSGPKQRSKRFLAQVRQCTGFSGVDRMVQNGYTFWLGLAWHSKHSVSPFRITVTWPRWPVLPASRRGRSAARHRRFTWRRASRLSRALTTTSNLETNSRPNCESFTLPWCERILASGRNCFTASAATTDFGRSTWARRKRNCRFKLDTSIVSRSTTSISRKPVSTRFFSSSQPMPPAPTTSSFACCTAAKRSSPRTVFTAASPAAAGASEAVIPASRCAALHEAG